MAIRTHVIPYPDLAFRLKMKVAGVNVAAPTPEMGQDYFIASSEDAKGTQWIDGIVVNKNPRLVRQFVALNPGTG